jgi:hypothetical protein
LNQLPRIEEEEMKMYEYYIENKETHKTDFIFGHSVAGAFKKWELNPDEWVVIHCEYID